MPITNKAGFKDHIAFIKAKSSRLEEELRLMRINLDVRVLNIRDITKELVDFQDEFNNLPDENLPSPTLDSSLEGITVAILIKQFIARVGEPKTRILLYTKYSLNPDFSTVAFDGGEIWIQNHNYRFASGRWLNTIEKVSFYNWVISNGLATGEWPQT